MKKSILSLVAAVSISALLTACGGSSDSSAAQGAAPGEEQAEAPLKVKPKNTNIGGKWGKAFDFEDREYTLTIDNSYSTTKAVIKVSLTRNANTPEVDFAQMAGSHENSNKYVADMEAEFFDENGESLFTAKVGLSNYTDIDKLLNLCEGDEATVTFSAYEEEDVIRKARTFRITSTMELNSRYGGGDTDLTDLDAEVQSATEAIGAAADMMNAMGSAMGAAADAANAARQLK